MATTISSSFVSGLFATFGVLFAIAVIIGICFAAKFWHERKKCRLDMPNIMLNYRKTLLKRDMYEEYVFISKFVKQLKNNIVPKELADRYIVDVNCNIGWVYDEDGDERLGFKYKYSIIPKFPFIKKKEEKGKEEKSKEEKGESKNEEQKEPKQQ